MPTYVLMTKLSASTLQDPKGRRKAGQEWKKKVTEQCPGVNVDDRSRRILCCTLGAQHENQRNAANDPFHHMHDPFDFAPFDCAQGFPSTALRGSAAA